jgi:hypothetical protein
MNMRRIRWFWTSRGDVLLLALVGVFVTGQAAVVQEPPASRERIQFASGATSATRKGSIYGYDTRDYILRASHGQAISVKLDSKNDSLYFNVLDKNMVGALEGNPLARQATEWTGRLPKAGDYVIRVYLVRAAAQRGRVAHYTLSMDMSGHAGAKTRSVPQSQPK